MAGLTTHVLDTTHGCPAAGMGLRLYARGEGGSYSQPIVDTRTNADGRCDGPLLSPKQLRVGGYRLEFDVAAYFRSLGLDLPEPPFLETVVIDFAVADADAHYHVPLLVSPFGYSTYRGS